MADETREVDVWITLHDKATGELKNVHVQLGKVARQASRVGRRASKAWAMMRRGMRTVTRWARRMLIAFVAFGSYMAQKFTRAVIQAGAQSERFAIQLRIVSNSAKEAEQRWQWVREFARRTPFFTQQVVRAFNILAAVGVKRAEETIEAVGNAAFVMNRDITEVSMAFVSLLRRVWRRLGVDLDRTGKKVKITTSRIRIETEKNVDAIRAGLLKVLNVSFPDGMKRVERTWDAMTRILASEWWEFRAAIAESGIFDMLKAGLSLVLQWIGKMREEGRLQEWAEQVSKSFEGMLFRMVAVGLWFRDFVKTMVVGAKAMADWINLGDKMDGWFQDVEGAEKLFARLRAEVALWRKEIDKSADSVNNTNAAMQELLASQKELLGAATKYAGMSFEQQRLYRQAIQMLRELENMDAGRAQQLFDSNKRLSDFVRSHKELAALTELDNKGTQEGLRLLTRTDEEFDDIVKKADLLTVSQRVYNDLLRQSADRAKEIIGAGDVFRQQARLAFRGAGVPPAGLESQRPELTGEQPGAFPGLPFRVAQEAARRSSFTETLVRAGRERGAAQEEVAKMFIGLHQALEELKMENNWNIENIINIDPAKLAEELERVYRSEIEGGIEKLVPVLQKMLLVIENRGRQLDATRRQQES